MVMPLPAVAASTPSSVARSATVGVAPELPPLAAVVAAPLAAGVAEPRAAVVAEPPPDAVVAVLLLLELSPPQAARTPGASATAAPAAPRRVNTCRRVTRPPCTGRCESFSVIPTAPCVVAGRPARHAQRNRQRARFMPLYLVRSAPCIRSQLCGRARLGPLPVALPNGSGSTPVSNHSPNSLVS